MITKSINVQVNPYFYKYLIFYFIDLHPVLDYLNSYYVVQKLAT